MIVPLLNVQHSPANTDICIYNTRIPGTCQQMIRNVNVCMGRGTRRDETRRKRRSWHGGGKLESGTSPFSVVRAVVNI